MTTSVVVNGGLIALGIVVFSCLVFLGGYMTGRADRGMKAKQAKPKP